MKSCRIFLSIHILAILICLFGFRCDLRGQDRIVINKKLPKKGIPPLFCLAYITPSLPSQAGQEQVIAKYPMAIVPQDDSPESINWKKRITELNPKIILLAYQMVIEETTVPGPGHNILRTIENSWATYPDGYTPKVGRAHKRRRIFDPRRPSWQEGFLRACNEVLTSFPYDGLFLDQCSIFAKSHPSSKVRLEMKEALQKAIIKLRRRYPNKIIIGNSRENWIGLNGEMNEGRFHDLRREVIPFEGHWKPELDLMMVYLPSEGSQWLVKYMLNKAQSCGAVFGATVTAQKVLWFDIYDKLMSNYRKKLISPRDIYEK